MSKNNKKTTQKKVVNLDVVFAYNRNSKIPPNKQIFRNIRYQASKLRNADLNQFMTLIFSHPLCPSEINCRHNTLETFHLAKKYTFASVREELIWFKHLFHKNKALIREFLTKKNDIEVNILNDNIQAALESIQEVEENITYSLWGIELQTHIKKELLSLDTSEYLHSIKQKAKSTITDFFIQQILLKSESKDIHNFINTLIYTLQEMRQTGNQANNNFADMASSYFIPLEFDQIRDIENRTLSCITGYSLIDQYLLFKSYVIDKVLYGTGFNESDMQIISSIVSDTDDKELINLFSDDIVLNNISRDHLNIVKNYTEAEYDQCQREFSKLIELEPLAMSCIEVYSRCNIYMEKDQDFFFYQRIANNFQEIINCNINTLENISKLEKIAIKFHFSSWSIPLLFHMYRFIDEKKSEFLISQRKMKLLGKQVTPYSLKNYNYMETLSFLDIDPKKLLLHRQFKVIDKNLLSDEELFAYFHELNDVIIIKSDYIKEVSTYLIETNRIIPCIKFSTDMYLLNNMNYIVLPIRDLLNQIEENNADVHDINISILYDIYSKRIDSDKDEQRIERFQDYIDQYDEYEPSKIFTDLNQLSAKEIYFLKNICVPETMDVYPEYRSTYNLMQERINILDLLTVIPEQDSEALKREKIRIFDELIFDQLKTKFDSSKIYVDVESLKNKREDTYRRLFETLLIAQDSKSDTEEYVALDEIDVWIPVSDMIVIVAKIYSHLLSDFVSNTDYGLDKYLSADIRHGFFVTHMRSGIEKYDLLSDIGENQKYEDNVFWLKKYELLNSSITVPMNEALKVFAHEFDTALKEANNWFKIRVLDEGEDKKSLAGHNEIFSYEATLERLDSLKNRISSIKNFDDFFNEILAFMWDITENAAIEAKNRLNTVLKPRLIAAFTTLDDAINECRHTVPMKELLEAISSAQYTMQNDLERVLNWFNCVTDNQVEQFGLYATIKACVETFRTREKSKSIILKFDPETNDDLHFLIYRETKALMSSIFTALVSARSNSIDGTEINFNVIQDETSFYIQIKNKFLMTEGISKELFLEELNAKFSDEYCNLSTSEGGSGLYKIYNLLRNASSRFSFKIDVESENIFVVEIGILK